MNQCITFADVNIIPQFSDVASRADVNLSVNRYGLPYVDLPVISANMDTVTEDQMAIAMINAGAQACLHRFSSIEENVEMLQKSLVGDQSTYRCPLVSIGLGMHEIERAEALRDAGACVFVIDVNHGANMEVVKQVKLFRDVLGKEYGLIVGNFATGRTVKDFLERTGLAVEGFKIGIGGGSTCTTRIKTGVGIPQLSAIIDTNPMIKKAGLTLIADGGMKTPGDVAKAIAAGAHLVMTGGMLAGTDETPGEVVFKNKYGVEFSSKNWDLPEDPVKNPRFKKYRGSASHESYLKQGKVAKHRAAEGESFMVPCKGPVANVLQEIEGGLRGSLSMVGAWTINEFHEKAQLVMVTSASSLEAGAHGKNQ